MDFKMGNMEKLAAEDTFFIVHLYFAESVTGLFRNHICNEFTLIYHIDIPRHVTQREHFYMQVVFQKLKPDGGIFQIFHSF